MLRGDREHGRGVHAARVGSGDAMVERGDRVVTRLVTGDSREAVLAQLPGIAPAFDTLYRALWQQQHVPAPVLELCRLRLAQLHDSAADWQRVEQPLPAGRREALRDWHRDPGFTAAERACLAFAEVYAMDAQALTDEQAEAVKAHYGDAGLVLLIEALGIFDGMARVSRLWDLPAPPGGAGDGR